MHIPVRPNPTEAMLPTLTWLSLDGDPSVRDRSRTMPVAGSVCSQKKANDRRDRSSRNASSAAARVADRAVVAGSGERAGARSRGVQAAIAPSAIAAQMPTRRARR
jgi:hypothetical protein